MKALYILPFMYFLESRLRGSRVSFHLTFEWLPAAVLAVTIGVAGPVGALGVTLAAYLAFISVYEIGYLVNDFVAAEKEVGGRRRGPQDASCRWILTWCATRVFVFLGITALMGNMFSPKWWSFFVALALVFGLHNILRDKEVKAATFQWLAWFRFMAPIMFVIEERQLVGVGLSAAVAYVAFRMFGYLDSKGLLLMPDRQRASVRMSFFLMPLAGVMVFWPYNSALGFIILSSYFALAALFGTLVQCLSDRKAA